MSDHIADISDIYANKMQATLEALRIELNELKRFVQQEAIRAERAAQLEALRVEREEQKEEKTYSLRNMLKRASNLIGGLVKRACNYIKNNPLEVFGKIIFFYLSPNLAIG
jgi:hypothetical protein